MAKPENKQFVWYIKNFSSLPFGWLYSASVVVSDVKWRLFIDPKGSSLTVYLNFAGGQSLPSGWGRYVKFRLTLVNQKSYELSIHREEQYWYDEKSVGWGPTGFLPLTELNAEDSGFLVKDELRIVAEIETLDCIGILDESKEASETLKKIKQDNDGAESNDLRKKTPWVKESMDVNGFQVHPSQEESVRRIFEEHPDIAVEFRGKNQHLRTTYMNFVLSLMETLRQPLEELSNEDLEEADIALGNLRNASFKVDWLETELDQVKEKKETEKA